MRYLTNQYYSYNQLKEVATPTEATDAANKAYVDQAVANAVGGGGGSPATLAVTDLGQGRVMLSAVNTPSVLTVTDNNNGYVSLSLT